jgi:ATP-dependent protease HslVU (ClpYQ) ATPase subunit
MKFLRYVAGSLLILSGTIVNAQDFKADLKKLQSQTEAAYKSKKITEVEYVKLQEEHKIIQLAIEKAEADGITTPDEKNKIYSKILRSKKRVAKYKTNKEVY